MLKCGVLGSVVAIVTATSAWSAAGDGPGSAVVTFDGGRLEISGSCSDWAFRTRMGQPKVRVDAGLLRGKRLVFQEYADLKLGNEVWIIKEFDAFESHATGYILSGLFEETRLMQRSPAQITIAVTCG